jgi:precorrin-6Y C5,15-methyltransferase (decarboxylating)
MLASPDYPPEALGAALVAAGCGARGVMVAARLGEADEVVWTGDVDGLAAGCFDGLSVVICLAPGPAADGGPAWAWSRPDDSFAHRAGLITKAEVRAVALGKLRLPAAGVLWDVGAGSGSVAAECAHLAPGLRVFAIERRPDDAHRLRANLSGTAAVVVEGEAPAALSGLPDPDRAFVGGGGVAVLDSVMARLRPGGAVVATYAALDRAAAAVGRLGHLVQVAVSRGAPVGRGGAVRLAAENPVFVCWGPEE